MFENNLIRKTKRILTAPQYKFLKQLAYWSLNSKEYGLKKDGKTWIYNTYEQWADQLHVSISTVRRTIKTLADSGFISLDYLSSNKRNRTLYYSINFDVIEEFLNRKNGEKNTASCVHFSENLNQPNEQMDEHMYIDNKKQDINKSYKSQIASVCDNLEKNTDLTVCRTNDENFSDTEGKGTAGDSQTVWSVNSKNTGCRNILPCQNMIKIWNQEFPNQKIISGSTEQPGIIHLTKQLARFLVASFKLKFENSLEKWRRYLRLIKTSAYMMGEKFKLSVHWVIKFLTIDRIRAGELGVDESKIPVDTDEIEKKAQAHIEAVDESEVCKQYRREIIRRLSPAVYLSWFTKVDLIEESTKLTIKAANEFVRDYIKANFLDKIGEFGKSRVSSEILQKN